MEQGSCLTVIETTQLLWPGVTMIAWPRPFLVTGPSVLPFPGILAGQHTGWRAVVKPKGFYIGSTSVPSPCQYGFWRPCSA